MNDDEKSLKWLSQTVNSHANKKKAYTVLTLYIFVDNGWTMEGHDWQLTLDIQSLVRPILSRYHRVIVIKSRR